LQNSEVIFLPMLLWFSRWVVLSQHPLSSWD
jgi:hypothetical protein